MANHAVAEEKRKERKGAQEGRLDAFPRAPFCGICFIVCKVD